MKKVLKSNKDSLSNHKSVKGYDIPRRVSSF